VLRYYPSSNEGVLRVATEDVHLGDALVAAGDAILNRPGSGGGSDP
jgi:cytochrome P450